MNEIPQESLPTETEIDEPHRLNGLVDKGNQVVEDYDIKKRFTNTEIAEMHSLMKDELIETEENNPELSGIIDDVEKSLKEAYPKYTKDFKLRDHLALKGRVKGGESQKIEQKIQVQNFSSENPKSFMSVLAHESTHFISEGSGQDVDGIYLEKSGILNRWVNEKGEKSIAGLNLNEILTNYFAWKALQKRGNLLGEFAGAVVGEKLEEMVGEKVLKEAYFEGKREALISALGIENFAQLIKLTDKVKFSEAYIFLSQIKDKGESEEKVR